MNREAKAEAAAAAEGAKEAEAALHKEVSELKERLARAEQETIDREMEAADYAEKLTEAIEKSKALATKVQQMEMRLSEKRTGGTLICTRTQPHIHTMHCVCHWHDAVPHVSDEEQLKRRYIETLMKQHTKRNLSDETPPHRNTLHTARKPRTNAALAFTGVKTRSQRDAQSGEENAEAPTKKARAVKERPALQDAANV